MNCYFGIHVGNSSICLALCKQVDDTRRSVEAVANQAGERVMPALATVTGDEHVVGSSCKSQLNTIVASKRMLGKKTLDGRDGEQYVKMGTMDGELVYELPTELGVEYRQPDEITSIFYSALLDIACTLVPRDTVGCKCVLMVPKHCPVEVVYKLRHAAEGVGWTVKHVMTEPCAAVLTYNSLSPSQDHTTITLVYRVGGWTCDVTVVEVRQGLMTILDSEHCEDIGGRMILSAFTEYLAGEFHRRHKLDPNQSNRALNKLMMAAESCMHVLSTVESSNLFVESLVEGVDFSYPVSRARFESILFPILPEFAKPLHSVLSRMDITPNCVDTVLFCGGPMKIPRLKKYIASIFNEFTTDIAALPTGVNYDEVLACGAAIQCAEACSFYNECMEPEEPSGPYLEPVEDMEPAIVVGTLEHSITIKVEGAEEDDPIVIPATSLLPVLEPVKVTLVGSTAVLHICQRDSATSVLKGRLSLHDVPNPVHITVEIDREAGMRILVEENNANTSHTVRFFQYVNSDDDTDSD